MNAKPHKRFIYISPTGTTYGPIHSKNEKAARKHVIEFWRLKSIKGYYFYQETEAEAERKQAQLEEQFKGILSANPHLCLSDFM
jgi:hypothetical protein